MATYRLCENDVRGLVLERIVRSYSDLKEADPKITCLFAFAPRDEDGNSQGNALTKDGAPILGKVKVVSLADRVAGLDDVTLTLDGDEWPDLTSGRRAAIIDTLLCSLEVRRDGGGRIKLDDANRPKLKVRPAEILIRGFYAVIQRHKEDAIEAEQLQVAWDLCMRQGLLDFELAGK